MSARRSTRHNKASAEPTQPAEPELRRSQLAVESPIEPPRKTRGKGKAARSNGSSQLESQSATVKTQSQGVTKVTTTTRAITASTPTTAATTLSKRATRSTKAAGNGSPLRALPQSEKKRKRTRGNAASVTPEPEPAQSEPAQDDDSDEQALGAFFSKKFDDELMQVEETSPARPVFVNGNESAIALLNKIENAAKETARIEPTSHHDGENDLDDDVTMEHSPHQSVSNSRALTKATPARPIATPSSFFSRSFSALKSIFSTPTPKVPASVAAPSPTASKATPAPNSLTESLSLPPTPVGERIKTPAKKKKTNHMLKALLKGVDHHEKAKAEEWAKQVIPALKNDRDFREKRKRLETPVLVKDLNYFPSSKPWETGFGDPLADLDDDDVVPGWAVYLDMMAEAEEPQAKKNKTTHEVTMDDDDILSINEQFAASRSASPSPMLHDSHGHSTSLLDLHPRRSTEPSPMFATPVSHQKGGNVFRELQGHDTAAQIRASDREVLQNATNNSVNNNDNTVGASFSVPDDSDEEDSTMISETSNIEETPAWTQAPPPAPVPAHAALPGVPADAASTSTSQQPVDEVERQRQKLMKHTPAKPSRLREATYPSPSLMSDAGNESILAGTPVHLANTMASMFDDIPGAEPIELDEEMQAEFDALINSEEYKQQLAANPWPAATLTYESDEEGLSPE